MWQGGFMSGCNKPGLALACLAMACCQKGVSHRTVAETPTPLIAGQRWMAPISGDSYDAADRSGPGPLRLADGRALPTEWIDLVLHESPAAGWLGPVRTWKRYAPGADASPTTTRFLASVLPQDAVGQSVWHEGRRLASHWILPDAAPARPPMRLALVDHSNYASAISLVHDELQDPRLRWRAEMALQRLGAEVPPASWSDPILHDWARQHADRWKVALHRLAQADAALSDRLLRVLTRWLLTPDGPLPAWPTNAREIEVLVLTLLLPHGSDEMARRATEAFLDQQPSWLAWVADDAGGIVGGVLAVANLGAAPALLSTRAPGGSWDAHGMLEPERLMLVPVPAGMHDETNVAWWEVRLGGRTRTLGVTTGALAMSPPGLAIGPLWQDWTLSGLIRQTATAPAPGSAGWIAGLVHRDPRTELPTDRASGWAVYFEVRSPPCDIGADMPQGSVALFFGPSTTPRAVVTVRCTGLTTFDHGQPGEGAAFVQEFDRWAFTLPIDRAWLEDDGHVLLGVQWMPGDGPRLHWPRPLLPNQRTPGRARIDPSAWSPVLINHADGVSTEIQPGAK
ncbi:MAG: hypothetical protein KIT54_07690 [Phycisphaeraceae bacterium]|nr:hypothetical protein [Phycisphaeraceae bacterium]